MRRTGGELDTTWGAAMSRATRSPWRQSSMSAIGSWSSPPTSSILRPPIYLFYIMYVLIYPWSMVCLEITCCITLHFLYIVIGHARVWLALGDCATGPSTNCNDCSLLYVMASILVYFKLHIKVIATALIF